LANDSSLVAVGNVSPENAKRQKNTQLAHYTNVEVLAAAALAVYYSSMSSKRRSSSSTVSINMNSNNSGSSIVDDCIVLYPYIYIALLAVHTNQKRFQCEKPREKRAVLRERKEALGSLVNKVDRVEGAGPVIAKAHV